MYLNIFSEDLIRKGAVGIYKSVIWNRKYFVPGEFEIYASATPNNIKLLKKTHIIQPSGTKEIGYIKTLNIKDTPEEGEMITAKGWFFSGIFSQRAILDGTGTLIDIVDKNCINTASDRIVKKLAIGNCADIAFENDCKNKNLGSFMEALARRDGFGHRVVIDEKNRKLNFETYYGLDRSMTQSVNRRIIFSKDYKNLITGTYTLTDVGAVDTVYTNITGLEGVQYSLPLPEYHIDGKSGAERQEIVVDVPAVTYDVTIGSGEDSYTITYLDVSKTLSNMTADANAAVVPISEVYEGEVSFSSGYKTKYDLGDIVTIVDKKLGVSTTQRICEVCEVYDNEQNPVTPTFGNPARTIMDILKG